MTTELTPSVDAAPKVEVKYRGGSSDAVYGIGLIGAWVFYLTRAKTFKEGALGFFKGIFWPAFLVYSLLKYLDEG
jgi:hypothetical protein